MRLVDTSAWVEWLIASSAGAAVEKELPEREQWVVLTIVQLELAKWLTRETEEDRADQVIAFTQTCIVVDLDTPIALSAAALCAEHKLATADAIVYATPNGQPLPTFLLVTGSSSTCSRFVSHPGPEPDTP